MATQIERLYFQLPLQLAVAMKIRDAQQDVSRRDVCNCVAVSVKREAGCPMLLGWRVLIIHIVVGLQG